MSQDILDIYHASPLEVGKIKFDRAFFEYDSVAILYNDSPILLLGPTLDMSAAEKASILTNSSAFISMLNHTLGKHGKPTVQITSNKIAETACVCIRNKDQDKVWGVFPIQEQAAKKLATLICIDPFLSELPY